MNNEQTQNDATKQASTACDCYKADDGKKGKIKLQDLFPEHKLMTIKECLDELGWEYTQNGDHDFNEIKCCGEPVSIGGWVSAEHANCKKCDKGMQDVTGILPHPAMLERGAGVCQHIDYDKTEIPKDGRVWIPIKCWG